jgi:hypothetical protein
MKLAAGGAAGKAPRPVTPTVGVIWMTVLPPRLCLDRRPGQGTRVSDGDANMDQSAGKAAPPA